MKKTGFAGFYFLLLTLTASSQSGINRFLTPSDTFNKDRTILVAAASWTGIYTGAIIVLNQAWYADYPHTTFHFFNDNHEWLQMDKVGHVYTGYFESVWTTKAFLWGGTKPTKAAWIGAATGFVFQSTIEVLDGFSEEWGASAADVIANVAGSTLSLSQYLLWNEQRFTLKFSSHPIDHPVELSMRSKDLFGTSLQEKVLKDYNGQTYWLSVNLSAFINSASMDPAHMHCKFPKWLNVAFGYGIDGVYGANENVWEENGETIDHRDIKRVRQFYLAPDIDFTRIKTKSATMKTFFTLLNILKVPAPALEMNSKGAIKFHPLYF